MTDEEWNTPPIPMVTFVASNLRDAPAGDVLGVLAKGARVGVVGPAVEKAKLNGDVLEWSPVITEDGSRGWVARGLLHLDSTREE